MKALHWLLMFAFPALGMWRMMMAEAAGGAAVAGQAVTSAPPGQPAGKPGAAAAPPAATPPAQDPAQAQRFAEVTRLQTENLNRARTIQTLEQKVKTLEQGGVNLDKLRSEAKNNPLKVMKELGLEFKEVAEWVINSKDGAPDPVKEQLREIAERNAKLEEKLSAREKAEEQAKLAAQIDGTKAGIQGLIDKGEQYELLKVYQSAAGQTGADLVFDIMVEHFTRTGTTLDEAAAAEAAENWLAEYGERLATTGKIQNRLNAKREAELKAQQEAEAAAKASGKGKKPTDAKPPRAPGQTLSNKDTGAAPAPGDGDEIDRALPGSLLWDKRIERYAAKAKAAQ